MGKEQLEPIFNNKPNDIIRNSAESSPSFDIHSIYFGTDAFPVNTAGRNQDAIKTLDTAWDPYEKLTLSVTPYKLPETEITGQNPLQRLNDRVTQMANENVQKRMTPEEKKELQDDTVKYAKQMDDYEKHMQHVYMGTGGIGLDDKPPPPPASIVKYEAAVNAEIEKFTDRLKDH